MPRSEQPIINLTSVNPSKKTQAENKHQALQGELASKNATWQAKQTDQTYLTLEQKKALLGVTPDRAFLRGMKQQGQQAMSFLPNFDAEVDWRTKNGGKVSPVKNQGTCGSCVSHATVGLIESMALIEKGILLDLSEADLHFCSIHGANCNGWFPPLALESARTRGVTDEAHFPYASAFVGGAPQCIVAPDRAQHVFTITSWTMPLFDPYRKDALTNHGPLVAVLDIYDDFFGYGSGIYQHVSGQKVGSHCILVVGYSQSQNCWICKNSWGEGWGEAGFFRIAYGQCAIDSAFTPFYSAQGVVFPA
jgi:C1A family cysteine protease